MFIENLIIDIKKIVFLYSNGNKTKILDKSFSKFMFDGKRAFGNNIDWIIQMYKLSEYNIWNLITCSVLFTIVSKIFLKF